MRISRLRLAALGCVCGVVGGLVLGGTPALALETYTPDFSFGGFVNVEGIAVEEAAKAVYVYDAAAGAIYKFNTAGEPEVFTGLGTNAITGVGGSGGGENGIAVDNSTGETAGDIYVVHYGGTHVNIYNAAGESLGELGEEGAVGQGEPCGVAVDSSGSLYVGLASGYVNKYTPTGKTVTSSDYVSSLAGLDITGETCDVAVDSVGSEVYVATYTGGVARYASSQFGQPAAMGTPVDAAGSTLAVDQGTGGLFVDEGSDIAQFQGAAEPPVLTRRFGEGDITGSFGVAVDHQDADEVYAADATSGQVKAFKFLTITPPAVTGQPASATHVAKHQALLAGTINAGQGETHYQFQYGTSTGYGQSTPLTDAGGGTTDTPTTPVLITELEPDTTYHYRLVASNVAGSAEGPDQTFTTEALTPPTTTIGAAAGLSTTTATITATTDTQGLAGTYVFELAATPGSYLAVAFGALTPQPGEQPLELTLNNLAPGTTYYYRLTTTTPDGTSQSTQATLTTTPTPPPPAPTLLNTPNLTTLTPTPPTNQPTTNNNNHKQQQTKKKHKNKKKSKRRKTHKKPRKPTKNSRRATR